MNRLDGIHKQIDDLQTDMELKRIEMNELNRQMLILQDEATEYCKSHFVAARSDETFVQHLDQVTYDDYYTSVEEAVKSALADGYIKDGHYVIYNLDGLEVKRA